MPRVPLEKLPLAARKDFRDNWESKKQDFEKQLTDILGTSWTIEVNLLLLHAYAHGSSQSAPGQTIVDYVEKGIPKLQDYVKKYGDDGKAELNSKASKHVLTIAPDDTEKVNYCACDIKDGMLRILFHDDQYGSWQGDGFTYLAESVDKAEAPADSSSALSFESRHSIKDFETGIGAIQTKLATLTGIPDIKLNPHFEENYAMLEKNKVSGDWKKNIGDVTLKYFESVAVIMDEQKFGSDDMLQEGFQEAVTKKEINVFALEKLDGGGSYNEIVLKDGAININSLPDQWGSWISDVGKNIVDIL